MTVFRERNLRSGEWLHVQPDSDNREPKFSGACRPYYYFPGTCPGDVDTLVLQVSALLPAPTQEASVEQAKHFSAVYLWRSRPMGLYHTCEHNQHGYSHKL